MTTTEFRRCIGPVTLVSMIQKIQVLDLFVAMWPCESGQFGSGAGKLWPLPEPTLLRPFSGNLFKRGTAAHAHALRTAVGVLNMQSCIVLTLILFKVLIINTFKKLKRMGCI